MENLNLEAMSYDELFVADYVSNGVVAQKLNDSGQCSKTVCPECFIDDFTHVEGCSKLKLIEDI